MMKTNTKKFLVLAALAVAAAAAFAQGVVDDGDPVVASASSTRRP